MSEQPKNRPDYSDDAKAAIRRLYGAEGPVVCGADPDVLAAGAEAAAAQLPQLEGALELLALYHLYASIDHDMRPSPILRPLFDQDEMEPIDWALDEARLAIIGTFRPTEAGLAVLDLLIPENAPHTYTRPGMIRTPEERDALAEKLGMTGGLNTLYNLAARGRVDNYDGDR